MNSPLLSKTWVAGAAVSPYRFVKPGADDDHAIQAAAATDSLLGVSPYVGAGAAEQPLDVILVGIGEIELGDTLARGQQVTADAQGRAVAASTGNSIGGKLLASGVAGDVVPILVHAAGESSASPLFQVDVTVSSAELLALNATPKQLVAAPGAGLIVFPELIQFNLAYNSAAYGGIAAGEDLEVRYTNGSGALLATIETTGFLDATANAYRVAKPTTTAALTPGVNAALVLDLAAGEITTGNSPLKVRIHYRLLTAAF